MRQAWDIFSGLAKMLVKSAARGWACDAIDGQIRQSLNGSHFGRAMAQEDKPHARLEGQPIGIAIEPAVDAAGDYLDITRVGIGVEARPSARLPEPNSREAQPRVANDRVGHRLEIRQIGPSGIAGVVRAPGDLDRPACTEVVPISQTVFRRR